MLPPRRRWEIGEFRSLTGMMIRAGDRVKLHSLSKEDINGCLGFLEKKVRGPCFQSCWRVSDNPRLRCKVSDERWLVKLDDGREISVKSANFHLFRDPVSHSSPCAMLDAWLSVSTA